MGYNNLVAQLTYIYGRLSDEDGLDWGQDLFKYG